MKRFVGRFGKSGLIWFRAKDQEAAEQHVLKTHCGKVSDVTEYSKEEEKRNNYNGLKVIANARQTKMQF